MLASDPDTLPYFVIEVQTERIVSVTFKEVTEADAVNLESAEWQNAVYRDNWLQYVRYEPFRPSIRKLVLMDEEDGAIQGIVRLGEVEKRGGFLRHSLLEAAPRNVHNALGRRYRGVGRVLVARLSVESYAAHQQGRLEITRGTSAPPKFYSDLGFSQRKPSKEQYLLLEREARNLLQSVLRSS